VRCFLAGLYIAIGGVWLAWLAGWINRVELRSRAEGVVSALGLRFERESARAEVVAVGEIGGRPIRMRWRPGLAGARVHVALRGGPWLAPPHDCDLAQWICGLPE
jgi:hypothetical protein